MNGTESVIPGLTRNPVAHLWIPAFAGMTWMVLCFGMTDNYAAAPSPASTKSSAAHTAAACARLHSSGVVRGLSG